MSDRDHKYWYNLTTHEVERGPQSPAVDRAGPFDTAEDAARAPEIIASRAKAWAEEDKRDDDWGSRPSEGGARQ